MKAPQTLCTGLAKCTTSLSTEIKVNKGSQSTYASCLLFCEAKNCQLAPAIALALASQEKWTEHRE
jgi:hypothetical protein